MNNADQQRLIRYMLGECGNQEKTEIELWLEHDPQHKELLESLKETWELSGKLPLNAIPTQRGMRWRAN